MLEIKNLYVGFEGKVILKGVNLKLTPGSIHALMGPNGSGKTTLSYVLMGHPKYKVMAGQILFNGEDITKLTPDERAKRGLFLSFQMPVEVPGVTISNFLRQAYNSLKEKKLSLLEFRELLEKECKELGLDVKFLNRYLNQGFSGGEKKKAEILQMLVLSPKIAVIDEVDSGTDVDSLKFLANALNKVNKETGVTILIITHYNRILKYLKPDKVFVIIDGKIVKEEDGSKLADEIDEKGYFSYKSDNTLI